MAQTTRAAYKDIMKTIACLLALSMVPLSAVHAQPEAVGGILNLAVDDGLDANFSAALAADPQGNYVVAWNRWMDENGSFNEIVFRKYTAGDQPVSARREINQHRPGAQQFVDVAMNASGWFAATWTDYVQDGSSTGIYARLYRGRKAATAEIEVPVRTEGVQQFSKVAIDTAGNFVVVWEAPGAGSENFDVFARRFDSTGRPLGKPYRVNTHTADWQSNADVAMRPDGRHVVVWRSWRQAGAGAGIYAQRYDKKGRRLGGEIRVHEGAIPSSGTPSVAMAPDGGFVVAWDRCDFSDPLAGCAVLARRFDAAGRPLSPEERISFDDTQIHTLPEVAFAPNGSSAVTWSLCEGDSQGSPFNCRVATRFHDADGKALSKAVVIDWDVNLLSPAVTAAGNDFLVAWDTVTCDSVGCGDGPSGVFGQRYRLRR